MPNSARPKLILLGTGFAAFSFMRHVDTKLYDLIVVSPRNHFLFTPLLPSTTVGTIEFRSIIEPIRVALGRKPFTYYQARCMHINPETRLINCEGALDNQTFLLSYNVLVVAVGATNRTFGIPGVTEHTLFLKELADARAIRQRIIECFERASTPLQSEDERRRLLHFVIVGGGPTGIEFAAELHDFLRQDLMKWFPSASKDVRITVLEAATSILNTFDARLGQYALRRFKRAQIEVRTDSHVKEVRERDIVMADGATIPYGLAVWSTGIEAAPLVQALPFPKDGAGRLATDDYFCVDAAQSIYAIGDCATRSGVELPATAQVAQQEGEYLAKVLNARAKGRPPRKFKYRNLGMLAYIGDNRALADLPHIKGRGFTTWLFWRSAYVTKLVSLKNKVLVLFDWFKTLIFGRDISRF
jgi:NADH:ubiquinone reductase (non-electrogenic)